MGANPIREPAAWDVFKVAGLPLPGIPKVTGCVDATKVDVRDGKGTSGATVSVEGKTPKPFKVQLHLVTEEDYDEWDSGPARQVVVKPPEGKSAKSYDVEYPKCAIVGIKSCITTTCGAPEEVGDGSYTVEIEMQPTPPPKPAGGVPKGSTSTAAKPNNAQDEADKQIAALQAQAADPSKLTPLF